MRKGMYPLMGESEDYLNNSPGRKKYSDEEQTNENLMIDDAERDTDNDSKFTEADVVETGLVSRTPMSFRSSLGDKKGVNSKSRSKYDGND